MASSAISKEEKNDLPKKVALQEIENNKADEKIKKSEDIKTQLVDDNLRMITAARVEEINKSNKKWKVRIIFYYV